MSSLAILTLSLELIHIYFFRVESNFKNIKLFMTDTFTHLVNDMFL